MDQLKPPPKKQRVCIDLSTLEDSDTDVDISEDVAAPPVHPEDYIASPKAGLLITKLEQCREERSEDEDFRDELYLERMLTIDSPAVD